MRGWGWLGGLTMLVAIVITACGGGGGGQPSGSQPSAPGEAAATITVAEKEWVLTPQPATAKAGTVKFVVKNEGTIEHNFVIKELNQELAASIQPGTSKEVSTTLKPGTYTLICNIPGHEDAGMHTTIQVTQ